MISKQSPAGQPSSIWLREQDASLDALKAVLGEKVEPQQLEFADDLVQQVPLYDGDRLRDVFASDPGGAQLSNWQSELRWVWESGPGIVVIKHAFSDHAMLDAVNSAFHELINMERDSGLAAGDHFAKPGSNDRVWNALEKLCLLNPALFAGYYSNTLLASAAKAWLGPNYQITSQLNSVNPGGKSQVAHRDYHLGFMSPAQAVLYPEQVHRVSPLLTLQCAVAHVDMPLESGPTLYLPHSQKYSHGYLLSKHAGFHAYFKENRVQLPLEKGDLVMFNPALLHGAGDNTSKDIRRLANLLQISSAFGRAMESVDRSRMSAVLYPVLRELIGNEQIGAEETSNAIAACAEGYAFPSNLDLDPPIGGLAPPSQQDLLQQALDDDWDPARFNAELSQRANRRLTHHTHNDQ